MRKLILFLFLICIQIAESQSCVSRFFLDDSIKNKQITRRFKNTILDFKSPLEDGDFLTLGIVSDSIDSNMISLGLYVYFPQNINPNNSIISIRYGDNSQDLLIPLSLADTNNYVEYDFAVNTGSMLRKKAIKICFKGIQTYEIEQPEYFIEFMKEILYLKKD
jgi:hypothetical protein